MDQCASVYVSKDHKYFTFECLYCGEGILQWPDYESHLRSVHTPNKTNWIDEIVKEEDLLEELYEPLMERNADDDDMVPFSETTDIFVAELSIDNSDNKYSKSANKNPIAQNEEAQINGENNTLKNGDDTDKDDEFSSSDEANLCIDKKNRSKPKCSKLTVTFEKRNAYTESLIELYKNSPCLWDPSHKEYKDPVSCDESYRAIRNSTKNQFLTTISIPSVRMHIKILHQQYLSVKKLLNVSDLQVSDIMREYFNRCSFLDVCENDFLNELPIKRSLKSLSFATINAFTLSFIAAYEKNPILYDDAAANKNIPHSEAFLRMAEELNNEYNMNLTVTEMQGGVYALRSWYYKYKELIAGRLKNKRESKRLKNEEYSGIIRTYVNKCSFLSTKTAQIKLSCDLCKRSFRSEASLKVHKYKEHNIEGLPFPCPKCECSFVSEYKLKRHVISRHEERTAQCKYCDKIFCGEYAMVAHVRLHHLELKNQVCDMCGKKFYHSVDLENHVAAIHTKIRAFKCTMCPKDYYTKRDLEDHVKAHLNIRDKICQYCGEGFTNRHALSRHRKIHVETAVNKPLSKLSDKNRPVEDKISCIQLQIEYTDPSQGNIIRHNLNIGSLL